MSNALLALLTVLLAIIGWFVRQTYQELRRGIESVRKELNAYQREERRRNNLMVATVMALQMELHPDACTHIREVMLPLLDGEE